MSNLALVGFVSVKLEFGRKRTFQRAQLNECFGAVSIGNNFASQNGDFDFIL